MAMSGNMLTYTWCSSFGSDPFQIKVFANSVEDARSEVLGVLDEIARQKSEYQDLQKEIDACMYEERVTLLGRRAEWENPPKRATTLTYSELQAKQDELAAKIPASFFNGCFAAGTFDYTADAQLGYEGETTLGDFIRNTEPKCMGPVHKVSFSSCLDG
jgi:hypothetical protein